MSRADQPVRYTDEEAALILRRAATLSERDPARTASGFTLEELQEIAVEAGIDPRHVAEVAAQTPVLTDSWARVLRAPTRFRYSQELGATVPEPAWSELVDQVREVMRTPGLVTLLPGVLEWRSNQETTPPVQVRIRSEADQARVDIDADLRGVAFASLLLPGTGGVLLAMLVGGAGLDLGTGPEIFSMMAAGSGGGVVLGWAAWRKISRRWQQRFDTLLNRLAGRIEEAASQPQPGADPGS